MFYTNVGNIFVHINNYNNINNKQSNSFVTSRMQKDFILTVHTSKICLQSTITQNNDTNKHI